MRIENIDKTSAKMQLPFISPREPSNEMCKPKKQLQRGRVSLRNACTVKRFREHVYRALRTGIKSSQSENRRALRVLQAPSYKRTSTIRNKR